MTNERNATAREIIIGSLQCAAIGASEITTTLVAAELFKTAYWWSFITLYPLTSIIAWLEHGRNYQSRN